ncbi:polysaccharide pyruvyl transferase family protein [Coleofasciculus chthonoplastes]|uniref:polysaccharide pyruvyl transferase family protein n=1 Tax=Coleofasciculus chthonoplastes TaxID=64178 RepID=UPI0032FCF58D
MKIAIFGYYNSLNAGDDRIQYCLTRIFQGNTVVFLPHYLPPPINYLNTFDWILIGGGGLVFERVGIWLNINKWIKKIHAHIGVLGIGVNHIDEPLYYDLCSLISRSSFFFVRDTTSKKMLDNNPKIEVYPDISWSFPIADFSYSHTNKKTLTESIALNLTPCPWKIFEPDKWINKMNNLNVYPFPLCYGKDRDFDLLKKYFCTNVPQEFSLIPLLHSHIMVGCRYHAITFAMQLRKPFIAINYDDKVYRLLSDIALLELCLETTEYEQIIDKINFTLNNKNEVLGKIETYALQQENSSKLMIKLIKEIMQASPISKRKLFIGKINRIKNTFRK